MPRASLSLWHLPGLLGLSALELPQDQLDLGHPQDQPDPEHQSSLADRVVLLDPPAPEALSALD